MTNLQSPDPNERNANVDDVEDGASDEGRPAEPTIDPEED